MNKPQNNHFLGVSIIISALIISGAWVYSIGLKNVQQVKQEQGVKIENSVKSDNHKTSIPNCGV